MKWFTGKVRLALPYLLAAAFVSAAVVWVVRDWHELRSACTLSPGYLAALLPLAMVAQLLIGLTNQVLAAHFGVWMRFAQWSSLAMVSTLANYVLPMRAGAAVRAAYFKKRHNFPVSKFTSTMVVACVTTTLANSVIGSAVLGWLWLRHGDVAWPLLWFFLALAVACLLVLRFAPRSSNGGDRDGWLGFVIKVHQGWDEMRRSPSLIGKITALAFGSTLVQAARMYLAYAGIGQPVGAPGCLLIGALVAVSMFITITPASLGIREGAIVLSSWAVGVSPELSLLAGAVDRAASIVLVAILGPLATIYMSHDVAAVSAGANRIQS